MTIYAVRKNPIKGEIYGVVYVEVDGISMQSSEIDFVDGGKSHDVLIVLHNEHLKTGDEVLSSV